MWAFNILGLATVASCCIPSPNFGLRGREGILEHVAITPPTLHLLYFKTINKKYRILFIYYRFLLLISVSKPHQFSGAGAAEIFYAALAL
jgi:hypothetical protein